MITSLENIESVINNDDDPITSSPSVLLIGGKNPIKSGNSYMRTISVAQDNDTFTGTQNVLLVGGTNTSGSTKTAKTLNVTNDGNLQVAIVSDSTSSGGGGTEYATNTTYSSGDNGKLLLGVKQSSHSSLG